MNKIKKMNNIEKLVDILLETLKNDKHRLVVRARYGLGEFSFVKTLESIGDILNGITRERVRQIQEAAELKLKSAAKETAAYKSFLDKAKNHLSSAGGLRKSDALFQELQHIFLCGNKKSYAREFSFLLSLANDFRHSRENDDHYDFWHINEGPAKTAKSFLNNLVKDLKRNREMVTGEGQYWTKWFVNFAKSYRLTEPLALNYLAISKLVCVNSFGDFGLAEWPEIRPVCIGDAIHLVLKKANQAMHFSKISELVNNVYHRKVSIQSVHNELIKSQRFALINRGVYAAKDENTLPPITKDAIRHILKIHGPMPKDRIVDLISSKKFVKNATVVLALYNKELFKKLGDGRYDVIEA